MRVLFITFTVAFTANSSPGFSNTISGPADNTNRSELISSGNSNTHFTAKLSPTSLNALHMISFFDSSGWVHRLQKAECLGA